jgi:antitoxin component of RelBE/YafQ-DinJ toxin-antitoxin module
MTKKMYSFRLNKNLIDNARKIAEEMDISLSLFISFLLREKVEGDNSIGTGGLFVESRDDNTKILREIASEIRELRVDLNRCYKINIDDEKKYIL